MADRESEQLTLINGNKKPYQVGLPKLVWLGYINDGALAHMEENTGLVFEEGDFDGHYTAQPKTSDQIVKLLLTYNVKTQYYNNSTHHNTLMLKSDHHVGFDVDSICYDCAVKNRVTLAGLKPGDYLAS